MTEEGGMGESSANSTKSIPLMIFENENYDFWNRQIFTFANLELALTDEGNPSAAFAVVVSAILESES